MKINTSTKPAFAPGDMVVYPSHGVGRVTNIETQRVGAHDLQLFVINFEQDRMMLRVPLPKAKASGLRNISTRRTMRAALAKLGETASLKRGIWNRRAVEYTTKINSGDPALLAEVVRDLHRAEGERQQSYSERLLYEQALGRLTSEFAAVEQTQLEAATAEVQLLLNAA